MNIEIANKLVNLRREKGFSQEELAAQIGISRQAVSKWERAESSPDTDNLIALARLYEISLDELLLIPGGEIDPFETSPTAIVETFHRDQTDSENEQKRKWGMFLFPYPIVAFILYFILARTGQGLAWLVFLTIPIYYGIAEMVYQRKKSIERQIK